MGLTKIQSEGIGDGEVKSDDLENSGVSAGTYGSSSAIPAITVDAKGRVTSASTSSIDSTAITNGTSNVSVASGGDITVTRAGSTALTFTGNGPLLPDSQEMRFGTGADLRIYHDSNNSYIKEAGSGSLIVETTAGNIDFKHGSEYLARFKNDDAVELYHDNTKRLETNSTGVRVTGRVEINGSNGRIEYNNTANTFEFFTGGNKVAEFLSGGSFVPGTNNTYDLGSGIYKWRHGYFDGNVYGGYFETDGSFRAKTDNGGIYFGDTSGGFGNSCAIARALQSGYHASYSQAGDFVIGGEYQGSILFGTTTSTSGGITGRCRITNAGNFVPTTNNSYDLGTSSLRWRNVYTNDLNLSNEGSVNDVDGTWGNWTIQEGEDDLFLLNRRNGKKYKFNLTEVG